MKALQFTSELMRFPSVSSTSNREISEYVRELLEGWRLATEWIEYTDARGVLKCCVAARFGHGPGGLAYFAHTDVVPAGSWHGPPGTSAFEPHVVDGRLYGRGSCDMKGSIGCMLAALEQLLESPWKQPLYLVFTADEEIGYVGATHVVARSKLFREMVSEQIVGIVGEPTLLNVVHAHKGVYCFKATAHGEAGHSSAREGHSANLKMIPFLSAMKDIHDETEQSAQWRHERFDPPGISWNIVFHDDMTAANVKAARSTCQVLFRPMPGQDPTRLLIRAEEAARLAGIEFEVRSSFPPLWVEPDAPHIQTMLELCGKRTPQTVCYGTDGAAFAELKQIVVLGPGDIAQAHTVDEWISLEQLEAGTQTFARIISHYCL